MTCNCGCPNFFYVTEAAIAGGELVLTTSITPAYVNQARFCFRFSPDVVLPSGYEALPVAVNISVDGTIEPVPLWDKYGGDLTGNELRLTTTSKICPRYVYTGYMGEQTDTTETTVHAIATDIPKNTLHCVNGCYC